MSATKVGKKKTSARHSQRRARKLSRFSGAGLALPEEELRRLVSTISTRQSVGPFVRRMVRLMNSLEAGRTSLALRWARNSKDPSFARLMLAVSREAQDGSFGVACSTAFCAAGYAYQNSVTYLRDLLSYIDSFNQRNS